MKLPGLPLLLLMVLRNAFPVLHLALKLICPPHGPVNQNCALLNPFEGCYIRVERSSCWLITDQRNSVLVDKKLDPGLQTCAASIRLLNQLKPELELAIGTLGIIG